MKRNKLAILLVILTISLSGCKKYLDALPRGIIIAKSTTDFRKLMDDVDNQRYQFSLSQSSVFADIVSDDVYEDSTKWNSWLTTRLHLKQLYAFEKEVWLYDALADDANWKNQFYIVSLMGTILTEITKATDNPKAQKQMIAEAKVHRAYAYLSLVNIYAKHYNPATAATDPGVPVFKEEASSLPPLNRASVKEVYEQVLSDLNAALPDLPDDVERYSHRPSKTAVYAILARAYLYMGNYQEALANSEKSLAIHSFLHDYNSLYTGTDIIGNLKGMSRTADNEVLLHKTTAKALLNLYMILDTTTFNAIYPDYIKSPASANNIDLRRTLKFTGFNTSGFLTGKTVTYTVSFNNWYKTDAGNSNAADNIHVGTPEMYMIRAECNARLGNLQKSLDDVNTIRMKRFKTGTYTNKTVADFGSDAAAILNEVLKERRRELYGKELRLFDVKRLHLPVTHYISSHRIDVPADDPKLVWPIYNQYITMNPELEQNPR